MRTREYFAENLGSFAPTRGLDCRGFIEIHDSGRYFEGSDSQLGKWQESRMAAVRQAADMEVAARALRKWRKTNGF